MGAIVPDVKPGEQLQQQHEEVSQRVTQAGDWVRKTDQTISESSMSRVVTADEEKREIVTRETTIKATDKTTVIGTASLMAGAVQHVTTGDYAMAVGGNQPAKCDGECRNGYQRRTVGQRGREHRHAGGRVAEGKDSRAAKSVATGGQQIMGLTVHIDSEGVNTLSMMLETIILLAKLAAQCASHSHSGTGTPTYANAFTQTGAKATATRSKYKKIIA